MEYFDKFKTVTFGGFKKEDVLEYIEKLIAENEIKVVELSSRLDELTNNSEDKNAQIKDLQTKLRQCIIQLQKTKNSTKAMEENHQTIISEKNNALDESELNNRQLSYKLKVLEEKLSRFNSIEQEKQSMISKAEKMSRDKTNEMIKEAKRLVEEEYNQKLSKAEQKSVLIINNAEKKALEIVERSKQEIKNIMEQAKKESGDIIQKANVTAKTIITDAAEQKLQQSRASEKPMDNGKLMDEFENELENLRQNIQQEVKEVIKQLDNASASVETAKIKAERIPKATVENPLSKETKKYKLAVKKFLNRSEQ